VKRTFNQKYMCRLWNGFPIFTKNSQEAYLTIFGLFLYFSMAI